MLGHLYLQQMKSPSIVLSSGTYQRQYPVGHLLGPGVTHERHWVISQTPVSLFRRENFGLARGGVEERGFVVVACFAQVAALSGIATKRGTLNHILIQLLERTS